MIKHVDHDFFTVPIRFLEMIASTSGMSPVAWLNTLAGLDICSPVYMHPVTKAEFLPTGRINVLADTEATVHRLCKQYDLCWEGVPAVAAAYPGKCYARLRVTATTPTDAVRLGYIIALDPHCESAKPEIFQPAVPLNE